MSYNPIKQAISWLAGFRCYDIDGRFTRQEARELEQILRERNRSIAGEFWNPLIESAKKGIKPTLQTEEPTRRLLYDTGDGFITYADYFARLGVKPEDSDMYRQNIKECGPKYLQRCIPRRVAEIAQSRMDELTTKIDSAEQQWRERSPIAVRLVEFYHILGDGVYYLLSFGQTRERKSLVQAYPGKIKDFYAMLRKAVQESKPYYVDCFLIEYSKMNKRSAASFHLWIEELLAKVEAVSTGDAAIRAIEQGLANIP